MSTNPLTQNLPLRQTMLSFAYLAYTGEGITTANPEPTILSKINAALPQINVTDASGNSVNLSSWSVVWGPVAYTIPGALYQENMMYVVQNGNTSQYAIAIRGTNFASQVDWFLEDFEVISTMPWPVPNAQSACAPGSAISESTSIDLAILLGTDMVDGSNNLIGFLQATTRAKGKMNICVTGHSLGGMLSNTLALYLLENMNQWDASRTSTVNCISFASPTAGNSLFASNANTVFNRAFNPDGSGSFPGWDTSLRSNLDNVVCSMDGAPLMYNSANLYADGAAGPLFSLYSSPNNPTNNIDLNKLPAFAGAEWSAMQSIVIQPLSQLTLAQNYTQLTTQALPGNFIGNSLSLPTSSVSTISFKAYLDAFTAQAAWQHSCSYPMLLNVPALFNPAIIVREPGNAPSPATISSISPSTTDRIFHPAGVSVTITGTGFDAGNMFGNFLLFSDPANQIPYLITSATETEIVATFYVWDLSTGTQNVSVVTSTPYYTSNTVSFTIS